MNERLHGTVANTKTYKMTAVTSALNSTTVAGKAQRLKKTLCRTALLSHVILTRSQCHAAAAEGAQLSTINHPTSQRMTFGQCRRMELGCQVKPHEAIKICKRLSNLRDTSMRWACTHGEDVAGSGTLGMEANRVKQRSKYMV